MKAKEFIEKNLKWIVLFICIILIIAIVEDVLDKEIQQLDIIGYNTVSKYLISDFATPIAKNITRFRWSSIFNIIIHYINNSDKR